MSNYGWTGKILRVNLSNESVSIDDTSKYKEFIGGMGIGYKVIADEVPVGTKPYDPENKIIFGAGPLTGSGIPMSSRTNITSLQPVNPFGLVADSHMGGNFAAMMKFAGYDAIIVEGKASNPVWLNIQDDEVTLENANNVWGTGIYNTTAVINSIAGKEASVAAIGQAGENMVNLSVIMNGTSHSAGGHGGVMGSKNLKAIAVKGTGSVQMAGTGKEWEDLNKYMLAELVGANNNHVVPNTPQPWAEYHNERSRWTAREDLYWGAAEPPIETGICAAGDINRIGYRTDKAIFDLGPLAEKYTVRMGGCQSCPIRCHSQIKMPQLKEYGVSEYAENTCVGYSGPNGVMIKGSTDQFEEGDARILPRVLGSQLTDDYGVWCNYGMIGDDFKYAYDNGILKEVLPADEYNSIPWDLLEAGDPAFLVDFYRRIALKEGEFSKLGMGTPWIAKEWNYGDDFWNGAEDGTGSKIWSRLGFPRHHSSETAGQVGAMLNCMFNRDAQCHTHVNITGSGLPIEVQKQVVADVYAIGSEDALDAPNDYTPVNQAKAKFAKWSIVRNVLHDSLTICNWMWPMTASPLKERNYIGDTAMEAKFMNLVTGEDYTEEELDFAAERIFQLHRALTAMQMNSKNMREDHDDICGWVFDKDPDVEAFTAGTDKLDRDDMQLAMTMFYKEMGWDEETGIPTRSTLEKFGLNDIADKMSSMGILA